MIFFECHCHWQCQCQWQWQVQALSLGVTAAPRTAAAAPRVTARVRKCRGARGGRGTPGGYDKRILSRDAGAAVSHSLYLVTGSAACHSATDVRTGINENFAPKKTNFFESGATVRAHTHHTFLPAAARLPGWHCWQSLPVAEPHATLFHRVKCAVYHSSAALPSPYREMLICVAFASRVEYPHAAF